MAKEAVTALALRSIEGTLPEKLAAFKSMAEALCAANVAPAGWEKPADFMAGCWMGDALGIHPLMFMMRNHVMNIDGRRFVEPSKEFITALLSARLPGFTWGVTHETDKVAEVWMEAPGRGRHVVRYTTEDAAEQGLLARWQKRGGVKAMLFKQAVKKCGFRIGPDVMLGLPAGAGDFVDAEVVPSEPVKPPEKSVAEIVDDLVEENPIDYRAALAAKIDQMYGKLHHKTKLMKLTWLANEMRREQKREPVEYDRAGNVPQADAKEVLDWLNKRGAPEPPVIPGTDVVRAEDAYENDVPSMSDRHAGEGVETADDVPPEDEDIEVLADDSLYDVDTLFRVCKEASKVTKLSYRTWIKESPAGSGVYWFTDMGIRITLGLSEAVKLKKDKVQVAPGPVVELLIKAVRAEMEKVAA